MTTAMYPGSFDPVTRGHLDIIKRASRMFDTLIVAVLNNSAKTPLFTVEERVAMLEECCRGIPNVRVASFDGLTVAFAKACGATVMVRGLRAVTDFENEIQLAHTNHALLPGIETVFPGDLHQVELPVLHHRQGGCPLPPGRFPVRHAQRGGRPAAERGTGRALNPFRILLLPVHRPLWRFWR